MDSTSNSNSNLKEQIKTEKPFIPVPQKNTPVIDFKIFSILQKKVESLELTANFIQQKQNEKSVSYEKLLSNAKNLNVNSNKQMVEEINKLSEKINIIEKENKENIDIRIKREKLKLNEKTITAEDIIDEMTKNEEIIKLQKEVKNLFTIFENVEKLEKKSKILEQISRDNSEIVEILNEKIEAVMIDNIEVKKSFIESPPSLGLLGVNVKQLSGR